MMKRNGIPSLCLRVVIFILACFSSSNAVESDISCLRSIKESLEDPLRSLSSWNFSNDTEGFICGAFVGVECWHPDESKVLNLRLPDMGLRGPFPMGIRNCKSLTGLDLSNNYLSGPIPSNIAQLLGFISTLDLSNNSLSGPIPPTIGNCSYINVLKLDNNNLTGQIPLDVSSLKRIKEFSVANNNLSGHIPIFDDATRQNYENNKGLCGGPLKSCKDEDHDDRYFFDHHFFSGFTAGISLSTFLSMLFMFLYWRRPSKRTMSYYHLLMKNIIRRKHHQIPTSPTILFEEELNSMEMKVTAMEKFIRRLRLMEIQTATNDFDNKNVIDQGDMGLMYKAVFPNALLLVVKRLHRFESFEKEFLSEIEIIGRLRHTNLVPLLGFCFEMEKKFLVYRYMCNGSLHQWLHGRPEAETKKMGWSLRLKIAVGIARGLAWLHHNNVLRVAHLRITSKCILLDENFEPRISNFGNAIILMNCSGTPLSVCNFVVLDSSLFKEDVYSFGILLLELVTGREPAICRKTSTWINSLTDHVCSRDFNLIDECLMGQGFDEEIYETLKIVEKCIHPPRHEASSMLQVYLAIRDIGASRSRSEISVYSFSNVENKEGDV
ncbi:probably inactive leucine-rich repeat receptor-like protein kinase At5g48380 [Lactuca sativa]|uniref:Protein kinase domain-containing protein n=1 Tax=Lactuca sativa TaxID=4236 RepID=A0A9R1UHY9_LACSA|nr:probably inactive leucine-rich repeat receptor-like protein kinase At5g48380 [Lactuca sativa]KAJ0187528.1 hypothetical protein LSAT_V11C900473530 [Lactuca sativa]